MIRSAVTGGRQFAARIDAATPTRRDRTVDALRALAIVGVILGHWLVTALVLTHGRAGTTVRDQSPLAAMPALTPVSWIFQTLAIFFLVGGYAAARSYSGGYAAWARKRLVRLSRPVAALAAVWTLLGTGLYLGGVSGSTLRTVLTLVLDPLWFLGVFVVLTALTPLAVALARRLGAWAAVIPLLVVASADLVRFGLGGPSWVGWINVLAGWMVPYLLGIAWARGAFRGWKIPAAMLTGGAAATVALVVWAGYPASMVGVNGARISNLNPPTLAVVTFGIAQAGLALLLRPLLARGMRRPVAWAVVAMANLSAMTLFLWHQTAFLAVTTGGLLIGRLPGLHTAPAGYLWVAERLAWLPVFAIALALLWIVFRRAERAPRPKAGPAPRSAAGPRTGREAHRCDAGAAITADLVSTSCSDIKLGVMDLQALLGPDAGPALGESRARVLDLLRFAGRALGVQEVAGQTGLHPNTARFHLDALVAAGLVTRKAQPRPSPGRRSLAYQVKDGDGPAGRRRYRLLAEMLTSMIAAVMPQPGAAAAEAGREWGRYLTEQPPPYQRPGATQAIEKLTAALEEIGFAPEAVAGGSGYQIRLHQCPFREVAERHQDVVCALHLGLMQGALTQMRAPLSTDRLQPFAQPSVCIAELTTEHGPGQSQPSPGPRPAAALTADVRGAETAGRPGDALST